MKRYLLMLALLTLMACGSARGLVAPEFTALKANEDVVALKVEAKELQATASSRIASDSTSVGGNMATTNDTRLMIFIIKTLGGLCATLIAGLMWCLKSLIRQGKEKDYYKKSLFLKMDPKESLEDIREEHDKYIRGGIKK